MITTLETLTLLGWHPDAGVWPLVAVSIGAAVYLVACKVWR